MRIWVSPARVVGDQVTVTICGLPDDDEVACIVCEDSGWVVAEYSDVRLPCPECDLGWERER